MWRDKTEILKPDERFANVVRSLDAQARPIFATIDDMHSDVAVLVLSDSVPQDIKAQFDIVRNAYIYSWFDYEMVTLAEMHAYTILEMAIRRRASLEDSGMNPKATMQVAINHARKQGWLKDDDYGFIETGAKPISILDVMVIIRNDLMHGKPHLYPGGSLTAIQMCFHAIQTLFPARAV